MGRQNEQRFLGKILTMLYPTMSGKNARSMTLNEEDIAHLQDTLQKAGPGAKICLKQTSEEYRNKKQAQLNSQNKRGSPAAFILEVLSETELEQERQAVKSNTQNSI